MRGELDIRARAKANHIQLRGGKSEMSVMRKRVPPQVRNTVARYIAEYLNSRLSSPLTVPAGRRRGFCRQQIACNEITSTGQLHSLRNLYRPLYTNQLLLATRRDRILLHELVYHFSPQSLSLISPHGMPVAASSSSLVTTWFPYTRERPWLTFTTEINPLWWLALALSFLTRFWRIDFPQFVVSVSKLRNIFGYAAVTVELNSANVFAGCKKTFKVALKIAWH